MLLDKVIKTEYWRKWMVDDQRNLSVQDILADEALSLEILEIAGHYTFNDEEIKGEMHKLYEILKKII